MTVEEHLLAALLAPLLVLAILLQLITLKHAALSDKELAKAGKRLMAAGFLIILFRHTFIPYYSVAVLGSVFVGIGSVFSCLERLEDMVNKIKYRQLKERITIGSAPV